MTNSIPKWVKLGTNMTIQENVILGIGKEEFGDLIIGDNSTIRSGTVIYRGSIIGNNFNTGHNALIREKNYIGNYVVIGSFSEIAPGNKINNYTSIHGQCFLEEAILGEYVFLAPGVKILDDMFPVDPDSKNYRGAIICDDVAIGGGSILRPNIKIGNKVLVGSGSVVLNDIPNGEVWAGNPARFIKRTSDLKYPWTNLEYLPGTRRRYEFK